MDQFSCVSIVNDAAPSTDLDQEVLQPIVKGCAWWCCQKPAKPRGSYCGAGCAKKARTAATRKRLKQEAVAIKGGKCEACGYDRCLEALQFHHEDPALKSFEVKSAYAYSRAKFLAELDKCRMLCANCHAEEEFYLRSQRREMAESLTMDWQAAEE